MKKLHMIGNAHLDPVWLWNWQEGYQENKATMKSALDRMDEFDDFIFTSSSAQFYEWIEENEPEMFERIRQRVKEGRWVICGGWWIQPDCNIPSGESFARHGLIAQNYFLEKFGVMAKTGYCVDSFGHNAMLPQILKKSGMDNYVFMRPDPNEKTDLPARCFIWEAPDGSRVKAFRIPFAYCTWDNCEEKIQLTKAEYSEGNDQMMCFYGVGNHGGGPTIEMINRIKRIQKEEKELEIVFSDPDTYFKEVADCDLPVVKDELQHHSPGCYTAEGMIKRMNRRAESALFTAEALSVVAQNLGKKADSSELTKAWKDVLFNQFHDTLAGSAIESAYDEARNQLGEAMAIANRCTNQATNGISFGINIPLDPSKFPLVIFNPNSWDVTAPVEFENGMFRNALHMDEVVICDIDGNRVEHQFVAPASRVQGRNRITFIAQVPALGYAVYFATKSDDIPKNEVKEDDPFLIENDKLKVSFDEKTGCIRSITDIETGKEVLTDSSYVAVMEDLNDTWGHRLRKLDTEIGRFELVSSKVADNGPVRKAVQFISKYAGSTLTQVFSLYEGEKQVHVKSKLNWQGHMKAVKMLFPAALEETSKAVAEIPYGYIEKNKLGLEEPMQRWVDLSDETYGLSILNDCKNGVDFTGNRIGITVLRSPVYAHHQPYELHEEDEDEYSFMDQGISEFNYIVKPHAGSWKTAGTVKEALLLNQPLVTMFETFHDGNLPQKNSFLKIDADNIIMTALKRPLHGEGMIIRFYEAIGQATSTRVDLMGTGCAIDFKPFEIKTFHVSNDGSWKEVNLLEM